MRSLFQGSAVPANALAPDANLKGGDLNDYNYNPEKAKEPLAEANWDPQHRHQGCLLLHRPGHCGPDDRRSGVFG